MNVSLGVVDLDGEAVPDGDEGAWVSLRIEDLYCLRRTVNYLWGALVALLPDGATTARVWDEAPACDGDEDLGDVLRRVDEALLEEDQMT